MDHGTRILWHITARTIAAVLIITGIAYCHVRRLPDEYRATTLLVLDTIPFERQPHTSDARVETPGVHLAPAQFLRTAPPHPISMPDYTAVLLCDEMMEQLRPAYQELCSRHGLGEGMPTRARVRSALEVRPRILLQTPYDLYYQHTLELHATTSHPELSAGLANAWAEQGTAMIDALRRERLERRAAYLEAQLDEVRERRNTLSADMRALEGQEGGIAVLRRELRMLQGDAARIPRTAGEVREFDDEEHRHKRTDLENRISELNRQVSYLGRERRLLETQIQRLHHLREESRLALGDAGPVFKIVSAAYPPDHPSGPNRRITLVAALLLGLILGPTHFFFMRALRYYAPMLSDRN